MKIDLDSYYLGKDERLVTLFKKIDSIVMKSIDNQVEKIFQYGMPAYVVPLKLYPKGYLGDVTQPLPYISIAIQKNYVSLYNMCFLVKEIEVKAIIDEYEDRIQKNISKGKSCIRFRKDITLEDDLISRLVQIMDVDTWISLNTTITKKK